MSETILLYDKMWYLPTSLVAKDGKVTLIIHRYQIRQGVNFTLSNKLDAIEFANQQEMTDTIIHKRYRALPKEADGNPQYIPKRVKTLLNKYKKGQ